MVLHNFLHIFIVLENRTQFVYWNWKHHFFIRAHTQRTQEKCTYYFVE